MTRPSLYKPEYCEQLKSFMEDGTHSMTAWAASIGVSPRTVQNWANEFEDFGQAYEVAKAMRTRAVERLLMDTTNATSGWYGYMVRIITNTAPDEYRDTKQQVELSGEVKVGKSLKDLNDEELAAIATGSGDRASEKA